VGLLCFAIWTLLDANQLYNSAFGGPIGARRTVAVAVLRPIAAVSNFLHLSGLVNWGENLVGHGNGAVGQNQSHLSVPTIPSSSGSAGIHKLPDGATPLPHRPGQYGSSPPPPVLSVPPLAQPTASHPLTILDIGDSVGTDLGFGLGDEFTSDKYVHVLQEGLDDTGLDRPDYWNWPGHLEQYLKRYHPGAVVIMMGANDDQNLNEKDDTTSEFCPHFGPPCVVPLGSPAWTADYTARVKLLMQESLLAGAHVLWVGMPPMGGGNVTSAFCQQINAIAISQAKLLPDVTYVSSWSVLGGKRGQFVLFKKINGHTQQIRANDGVHLDPYGWDLLAAYLVDPMEHAWRINLHVST
jgi:uncharacterized protein